MRARLLILLPTLALAAIVFAGSARSRGDRAVGASCGSPRRSNYEGKEGREMICDRCGKETGAITASFFNTDTICLACDAREREHPDFERARRIESEAVRRGDYNYPGIGLPADLQP